MNAPSIDLQQLLAQDRAERDRLRSEMVARCGEARGLVFFDQLLREREREKEFVETGEAI